MKGFIVYPTFRIKNGKSFVFLFGKLENGETFVTINSYKPYFFIESKDLKEARRYLASFDVEETKLINKEGKTVVKILLDTPDQAPKLRKVLDGHGIQTYEADIKFAQRFLIDKGIQGSMEIEGDYNSEERIDRIYMEPSLKPTEYVPKLKVLSIDIETPGDASEIYCISLYTDDFKKVLINSDKKLKNAINCKDEEDLLEKFANYIEKIDPDIITGWHFIDFDLKVLQDKFKEYQIPFVLGRDNSVSKLRIESSFFRESKADLVGRQVLDGIHILKSAFIKLPDYKLDTAASEILGDKKLIGDVEDKGAEITRQFEEETQKLVDYNLKDSELVYKILEKTDTINLTIKRSLMSGMPLDKVSGSIGSLDSLYLKRARKKGYVLNSQQFTERVDQGVGGFVMDSKPGIYDNLIVFDFKSLYPSVIRTFNIDPLMITNKGKGVISSPAEFYFKNEEGILPAIIGELWREREIFRKNKDEIGRYAVKILMNSFYGAVASPLSRYFNRALGNSITLNCQFMIKNTAQLIREKGYEVIYGDTDSIFVVSKAKDLADARTIGKKIEKEINDHYDSWIKKEFGRKSFLELEFEKTYTKFLLPMVRGGTKGAKKRYAGLLEGKKVDVVGMEAVRGDWTELAKKYQREVLDKVFHDKEVLKYTQEFVEKIRNGKFDDLLIYKKSIRKDLKEYVKTTPPHIKAARKLDKLESTRIEYVITVDGPEPIQKIRNKLDYEHYIEKQIKPIAESILGLLNQKFEDVAQGHKQLSLGDF
jgi:DNA polymerase II